ncbi:hypothetical protein KKE45_00985, partial [Patescibacteria group bacterium]|nr:hypothetical protein [Patescibacteria group bacterium]
MNNTVLQIPINKTLRNNMTKMAVNMGFSSLQELTRVIFTQLEKSNLRLSLEPKAIKLSPAAIKRYDKMSSD